MAEWIAWIVECIGWTTVCFAVLGALNLIDVKVYIGPPVDGEAVLCICKEDAPDGR